MIRSRGVRCAIHAAMIVGAAVGLAGCGSGGSAVDTGGSPFGLIASNSTATVLGIITLPMEGMIPSLTVALQGNLQTAMPVMAGGFFSLDAVPPGTQIIQVTNSSGVVVELAEVQILQGTTQLEPFPDPMNTTGFTGIMGMAYEGPVVPLSMATDAPDESSYPGAVFQVQPSSGGAPVATVTADSNGNFSQALPAGTYMLVPTTGAGANPPKGTPFTFTVTAGQTTSIQLNYDTGIR